MLENLDGFVFRRNVRQEPKARKFFDEGSKEQSIARGNTDGIFSFKFVRSNKRRGDSEEENSGKRAKEKEPDMGVINENEENALNDVSEEISEEDGICSNILIKDEAKKRISISDLHTKLGEDGTLGELVRLCVEYALQKKKIEYGINLERKLLQNEGSIKRRDVEREIEEADRKILWVSQEEEKWNSLKTEVLNSSKVDVREVQRSVRDFGYIENMEEIRQEFVRKFERLEFLKESAKSCISRIREQSEDILGRVLRTICREKEVDTLFLLRTLSKTNK
ncbi:hypothetical protein EROM_050890 [Encephalitozoon romaleae SJ-2008]|uniref:Uncharacterized protein n=1 Tax=Encephalitozoon romaleae (strain SJ-2008) TaxID=1178016 RepID=I6ZTM7_ENCRO|nr:hypothetical protein EROM_050890 [Encephalitozoon romaleae SJ-2008]AFN83021.1 hypothetical protein EROM_050890 [Encephalitozoon romaleae SJ-2008]